MPECEHDFVIVLSAKWQMSIGFPPGFETVHKQCRKCDIVYFREINHEADSVWSFDDPDGIDFCYKFVRHTMNL